jgi:hypothetical protein
MNGTFARIASLVLAAACGATTAMAKEKPKPRAKAAAPAAAPAAPVVTLIGVSVVAPGIGGEEDHVQPFSERPGTELTLGVTVTPPAALLKLEGEDGSVQMTSAGAPLEGASFGWSSEQADDGHGASIVVRADGIPGPGAADIAGSGRLKALVSPGLKTEKAAGVKIQQNATFRLAGGTLTITGVEAEGDSLRIALRGPMSVVDSVKELRLKAGTAAPVLGQRLGGMSDGETAERVFSFATKAPATATLEADVWQAPREATVPFQVTAGLALPAPPRSAATLVRSAVPPLPLGTAEGEVVVDGKVMKLAHAAAVSGPDHFDETKEAFTVYLTEKPVAAGVLESAADLKAADQGGPALVVTVRPEGRSQSYQMLLRHPGAKDGLSTSSSLSGKDRWLPVGPERVAGVVKSFFDDRPTEMFGHQVQYRIKFNAPVKKRFPVEPPLVLAESATKLGAGGGAPGKAYLASECAPLPVNPDDPKSVEAFLAKEGKLPTEQDLAEMSKEAGKPVTREDAMKLFAGLLGLAAAMRPAECKVLGGAHDGKLAILQVQAQMMGSLSRADAYLVNQGGTWKFKKHGTWREAK